MRGFQGITWGSIFVAFFSAMAGFAQAEEVNFGPAHSLDAGGTITFDVPLAGPVDGDGSITITIFGDLNSATEVATLYIDGTRVGVLNGGTQCGPDVTETIIIPVAVLNAAASDGTVTVALDAEDDRPGVDGVDDFCNASPPYSTVFNFGDGVSIAARGTLTFTAAAAPSPAPSASEEDMIATRAALIQSSAPNTSRRVDRLRDRSALVPGTLSFEGVPLADGTGVELELGRTALAFNAGFDLGNVMVWSEGRVLSFNDDLSDEGRFAILHAGADWLVGADLMLGVAAQIDVIEQEDVPSGETVTGTGWMLGPVATARLSDNLFVDARLAFGTAQSEVDRGATLDRFDSCRALLEIAVLGFVEQGNWTFYPEFELSYFAERAETYNSATLGVVPAREFSLGQARIGGTIERAFPLGRGDQVTGYAEAFANYRHRLEGAVSVGSFIAQTEGWTGQIEIGGRYETRSGALIHLGIGTGGLFSDAESVWANLGVSIPLR